MSEFMPTTDQVRDAAVEWFDWQVDDGSEGFDRWLAEVERAAAASALEDAADEIFVQHSERTSETRMAFNRGADAVYDALRACAERMKKPDGKY